MKNLSRHVIHRLFVVIFSETASHGIPPLHALLFLFLFSVTIPFSTAQSATDPTQNAYGVGFKGGLNPSMTVVIVVLVCAFFFIGFFAVYLRHCTQSRSAAVPLGPRVTAEGGLDPELIETFPIIEYSAVKDLKIGKAPLECAVCLNEFEDDESLRLLPKCDHVFHPDCIDEWLASHITCPVCRTNLTPEIGEIAGNSEPVPVSNELPSQPKPISELGEERNLHVSINIPKDQTVEIGGTSQTLKQNRPPRSRSTRTGRFPRSHSTGHSLVQPGESFERYTLRLPDEVRKQIAMNSKLNRTRSHGVVLPRVGSSRRGYRSGGEGSGRFDRWVFTMAPPFLSRGGSVKSPKIGGYGDVTAEGGNNAMTFLTSVKAPLDCLAAKDDGGEHSSARPQV